LIYEYFPRHGIPERILSDQGTNFTSSLVKALCRAYGIRKLQTTAYHPQCNGVVERFHRTLAGIIAKLSPQHGTDWRKWLPIALAAHRNLQHGSTGYSPNYLVFGRELRYHLPNLTELHPEGKLHERVVRLQRAFKTAQNTLLKEWKKREGIVNARRTPRYFHKGQEVYLRQMVPPAGIHKKFYSPWIGPQRIKERLSEVTYVVVDVVGKEKTVHISRLKPAYHGERADGIGFADTGEGAELPGTPIPSEPKTEEIPDTPPQPTEEWYHLPAAQPQLEADRPAGGLVVPQESQPRRTLRLQPRVDYLALHTGRGPSRTPSDGAPSVEESEE